ncbi:hypothetical protein L581_0710 [Serratia fonticola AU-AP2C]|nr:hypothetical protein L581_0710 [Serratia fonticola AU-AP2C]
MREPISLSCAEYRSGVASSLYEVILEKACNEASPQLTDLIGLACDINQEVHKSLVAATQSTTQEAPKASSSAFDVINQAENALMASKQAQAVLSLWLDSIPHGEQHDEESHRVAAVMSLLDEAISYLKCATGASHA